MRFLLPIFTCLAGLFCFPSMLSATTIVPYPHLGVATDLSEVVVMARAEANLSTPDNGAVFRDTRFTVTESVKGVLNSGQSFSVRAMSYSLGAYELDFAGDFGPTIGKTYLLFLQKSGTVWKPVLMSYYVFEQLFIGNDEFLVPIGGEGFEVVNPAGFRFEPLAVYEAALLRQNLARRALDSHSTWDGSLGRTALRLEDFTATDRTVPDGCDFMLGTSTTLARWQNAAVPIYYDDTNVPANWTGTFNTIVSTLGGNYSGILPNDAGPTSYTPDCAPGQGAQGLSFQTYCNTVLGTSQCAMIMFDDPCSQIPDLQSCSGILALGGSYSSSSTHVYDGMDWRGALFGYVIVNNGVPDCWTGSDFEQMLTHELTHVYRMDHLDDVLFPQQNMNPICCNAINTKDIECMDYAYSVSLPVELTSFNARVNSRGVVDLSWATASEKDNAFFTIERSADGMQFEKVQQVPAKNSVLGAPYTCSDEHPLSGVSYYRLSQTDFDGTTRYLNIKTVTVTGGGTEIHIVPNPVAEQSLRFRMDLALNFDGALEVLNVQGEVVAGKNLSLEKGSTWITQPLDGLTAGVYTLRINDGRQQWTARFTKK